MASYRSLSIRLLLVGLFYTATPVFSQESVVMGRVIAVGIPGSGAVSVVGYFHPGGPIHDKPEFAAYTQAGRILDPDRIVITSTSNFGAPKAMSDNAEGALLSLDVSGTETFIVPPDFATGGDQASALDGKVQLFTAQSPKFVNSVNTPASVSASWPPVSNPLGISINNGFGRLWFANAPGGSAREGTESIVDPGGQPLAGAPSKIAGGVFVGGATNRRPAQLVDGGLHAGAVANALLGMSPDGSKRAVFAVLTADGALIQAHTEELVDGLAPPGTIGPLPIPPPGEIDRTELTRAGMLFNWVPDRILYVSDPARNAVLAIKLTDDGRVFRADSIRRIEVPEFSTPVDLAPAITEAANPGFSSNTTLAGSSDFYVVNRGSGIVLRLTQAGQVVALRRVSVGGEILGARRLNGIAVSRDGRRIYLTVTGQLPGHPGQPGALIEVAAFGDRRADHRLGPGEHHTGRLAELGARLFRTAITPAQGLGPLYNATSCGECHSSPSLGGSPPTGLAVVLRVGRFEAGLYDPLASSGGPVARAHAVSSPIPGCGFAPGVPAEANLVSVRNAPSLFGVGLIDRIPDDVILAQAEGQPSDIRGRPNWAHDVNGQVRVGRFGWKADVATLEQFVAEAMRNEMGITNPLAPVDLIAVLPACGRAGSLKDDGTMLRALTAFIAELPLPQPKIAALEPEGVALFSAIGCAICHIPTLAASGMRISLYSDLLLHDIGVAMDDGVVQGQARGRDWRTTPLWGLGSRLRFLHDGRATTIAAAINLHDGEAARSAAEYRRLAPEKQDSLLRLLAGL